MKNCAICENSEDVKIIKGKSLCVFCRKNIATGYFIDMKRNQRSISAYSSGIIVAALACVIRLIIYFIEWKKLIWKRQNITLLKNEIQNLTEQKNKLCSDNKAIDAKLREYDSVKKNLEKIIEDTAFKQDQEQREIKNEWIMIFILREKVHIMEDNYCLCCGKKISNEQGKIKELNDNFKPKISKRIVEIVFVIFINIFYCFICVYLIKLILKVELIILFMTIFTTFIPLICKVKNFITCNKETSKLVLNEKYICENCMTKINKVLFKRRFIFNIAISLWLSFGEIAILLIFMFLIK